MSSRRRGPPTPGVGAQGKRGRAGAVGRGRGGENRVSERTTSASGTGQTGTVAAVKGTPQAATGSSVAGATTLQPAGLATPVAKKVSVTPQGSRGRGRSRGGGGGSLDRSTGRGGRGGRRGSSKRVVDETASSVVQASSSVDGDLVAAPPVLVGSRVVIPREDVEASLRAPEAMIGEGTRACVLFHESAFDSAMLSLDPNGAEMVEPNISNSGLLYFVTEGEDDMVEFSLPDQGYSQRLSKGSEVLVPPRTTYALRNHSARFVARLVTVVPRE
eukprot:TRINITY_DN64335_c0_g1_i1.p1 TRINITY_DN64335_c0_g1~~TRINITY_DN64335_c0_g1_i1.p1  ORF type:complete len:273 (+),score=45.84 TRINITY_DN64335_c0_g1_i1:84-902(+)